MLHRRSQAVSWQLRSMRRAAHPGRQSCMLMMSISSCAPAGVLAPRWSGPVAGPVLAQDANCAFPRLGCASPSSPAPAPAPLLRRFTSAAAYESCSDAGADADPSSSAHSGPAHAWIPAPAAASPHDQDGEGCALIIRWWRPWVGTGGSVHGGVA